MGSSLGMTRVASLCPDGTGPAAVTDSPGMGVPGRSAHWATTMLSAGFRRTVNCGVDMLGQRIAEDRRAERPLSSDALRLEKGYACREMRIAIAVLLALGGCATGKLAPPPPPAAAPAPEPDT